MNELASVGENFIPASQTPITVKRKRKYNLLYMSF